MTATDRLPLGSGATLARWAGLALCMTLIVVGVAWELSWAPLAGGQGRLALKVLPLVLALPGLLQDRLQTFRWLSLAVWIYAAEGVVRLLTDRGASAALAGVELALAVALFAACAWRVRAPRAA